MIDRDEVLADLQATVDYVHKITEGSDSFEFELASELNDALQSVIAAARQAQSLVTTQMLVRLEEGGPRVFGDKRFERRRTYTERTNHHTVISAVIDEASEHDTPRTAAQYAARLMEMLYVSNSTNAKKGEIDKMSLARDAVFTKNYTGWKVDVTEVPET